MFAKSITPLALLLSLAVAHPQKADAPKEHTVEAGPFRKTIAIDANFTPASMAPVTIDPEHWKTLSLLELKPHGTRVEEGDIIATFDVEALEKRIEEAERNSANNADTLKRLELEIAAFRQTHPIDLAEAIRKDEQAAADHAYWKETGRPLAIQAAERELVNAGQSLYYAQEELKQLRKMYEADNLVEETEEIILKRSVWAVERGEIALERTRLATQRTLEIEIPRKDTDWENSVTRIRVAREKAEADHAAHLAQREFDLAEKQRTTAEAAEDLEKMKRDLELLRGLKAPASGVLLWGDWSDNGGGPGALSAFERKYNNAPKTAIQPRDIFATIAQGAPTRLVGKLAQADRHAISWRGQEPEGITRHATLEARPGFAFPVRIADIDAVPDSAGTLGIQLSLEEDSLADDDLPPVSPGMKARVVLLDYSKDDAIRIPASFLRTRFADGRLIHEVRVSTGGESPEVTTRAIQTGHRSGENVEILDGLEAGEILVPHS